jgi:hypothetical protein
VEKMKYYIFYRESDNFDDIIKDKTLKKYVYEKFRWSHYLKIGVSERAEGIISSYITLKYGDEMRNELTQDYSPKPYIDYTPKRKIK